MKITVRRNGVDYPVEANNPEEAAAKAVELEQAHVGDRSVGESVSRFGKSVATGVRDFGEQAVGLAGDLPGMASSAADYAMTQADKIPFVDISPETREATKTGAANMTIGLSPMSGIARALQAMGIITPEQKAMINPTTQDVHGAVQENLPTGITEPTSYEPTTSTEKFGHFAGNFLPSIFTGGAEIKAAKGGADIISSLLTRAGTRVATPAAALTGSSDVTDKLVADNVISPETATAINTVVAFASGAGGAMAEGPSRARAAVRAVNAEPQAVRAVYEALKADGLDEAGAIAKLDSMGIDSRLVDLGPTTRQTGVIASSTPGTGRTQMVNMLEDRQSREGARLGEIREEALGSGVNRDVVKGEIKQELSDIGKGYETAHPQQRSPVNAQSVIDQIDTELGSIKDPGLRKILEDVKKSLYIQDRHGVATPNLDPSSEGLQGAREAIDSKLYDVTGKKKLTLSPQEARLLTKYRGAIDDMMEGANPAVKAVDEAYSAKAGERKAFETGEDVLKKADPQTAGEFQTTWDSMSPEQQQRAVQGASRYVETQMGLSPNERTALRQMLGGDLNEAKLSTMIGPEKTRAFMEGLHNNDEFNKSYQKIVNRSPSGDIVNAGGGGRPITEGVGSNAAITGLSTGSVTAGVGAGAMTAAKNWMRNRLASSVKSDKIKNDISKLLSSGDPQAVLRAAALLRRSDSKAIMPHAILGALVARQDGGPR